MGEVLWSGVDSVGQVQVQKCYVPIKLDQLTTWIYWWPGYSINRFFLPLWHRQIPRWQRHDSLGSNCEKSGSRSMIHNFHTWIGHQRVQNLTPLRIFRCAGENWQEGWVLLTFFSWFYLRFLFSVVVFNLCKALWVTLLYEKCHTNKDRFDLIMQRPYSPIINKRSWWKMNALWMEINVVTLHNAYQNDATADACCNQSQRWFNQIFPCDCFLAGQCIS